MLRAHGGAVGARALDDDQVVERARVLDEEVQRATGVEASLQDAVDDNAAGISTNAAGIAAETARASGVEDALQSSLNDENQRATAAEHAHAP